MTNTFVTWLLGAAIAGLALLFLLGTPATDSTATAPSTTLTSNGAAPAAETSYWQSVASSSASASVAAVSTASPGATAIRETAPCSSCSTKLTGAASTVAPAATAVALSSSVGLVGGCGSPVAPCSEAPCTSLVPCGRPSCPVCGAHGSTCMTCEARASASTCATSVCDDRPRISRNGPSCVDECSFLQLWSTIPLPVCPAVHFAWAATRGEFLDPHSPTPVYFAPSTGFTTGEEVLVTLTVTDAQGNKYTDQMKLHVNDIR